MTPMHKSTDYLFELRQINSLNIALVMRDRPFLFFYISLVPHNSFVYFSAHLVRLLVTLFLSNSDLDGRMNVLFNTLPAFI